ncbi:hypothetical protein PULV_b0992 [Pseudoalteromonas ulvae UL12]|uniref:ATP-binding cassette domain-containing protein n=1 Tax=Pseudoalteromonas ulvae TaxID=107327 RepID=UPI00186B9F48|nr:ATP-binding cassette domain-containing protein [Pseudoalteromonas ulvae]MBE0366229.1 hypothetical protein [Pseudoalteromonas ulvae UL12]
MLNIEQVEYTINRDFKIGPISLTLSTGFYHLLGPNGSGKTTLLDIISGLIPAKKGIISISEEPVTLFNTINISQLRRYLTQQQDIHFSLSVKEMLFIAHNDLNIQSKTNHIILAGLDLLPLLDKKICNLSGGEQQRAHLARVLLNIDSHSPQLLLFDEPYTGLDVKHKYWLNHYLKQQAADHCIIICHHELNLALNCNQSAIIMNKGAIHTVVTDASTIKKDTLMRVFSLPEGSINTLNDSKVQIIGI